MAENTSFVQQYETYPGKTLGNYYLERLIEQLETGPVFLARHIQTKTFHRLHFLALPAGLSSEERLVYLGHFQREAGSLSTLDHPAIFPLQDYGIYQSAPYLVWPDVPLQSLQSMLSQNGPMEAALTSRFIDQISSALEYAHQRGILHLNVHTKNIGIRKDGQLVVSETGLVRMLSPRTAIVTPDQRHELENGTTLLTDAQGKPLCGLSVVSAPAPELLLGQSVNSSADVYSLGALLYFLLTGHRTFRGKTLQEIAQQHLQATVPPLTKWRQDLPARLDALLNKALEKDPGRRFLHPGELANAYAQLVMPAGAQRTPIAMATPTQPSMPKIASLPRTGSPGSAAVSRRRALTLLAAGGSVVAVSAVAIWFARNAGASTPITGNSGTATSAATVAAGGSTSTITGSNANVLARTSDVPVNSSKAFPLQGSNNPGLLIHLPDSQFVAFDSTCTHAGCAVKYNTDNHLLECPCHGASFDPSKNAAVIGGPAPSPLNPVGINVNSDGTITKNG
ncbi:MAG TPA: protein kinase [Ktedonobacteraceae bacterium]|nr:protein kinase [Ktedonobacteraceae bacterium]